MCNSEHTHVTAKLLVIRTILIHIIMAQQTLHTHTTQHIKHKTKNNGAKSRLTSSIHVMCNKTVKIKCDILNTPLCHRARQTVPHLEAVALHQSQ